MFNWLSDVFDLFSGLTVGGISLTSVLIVVLIITGVGFLIRGNK